MPSSISNCVAASWPENVPWEEFDYVVLESPSETAFIPAAAAAQREAAAYPAGRLFGAAGELRWRQRRDGQLRFVWIRDDKPSPEGWNSRELDRVQAADYGLPARNVLWGERLDGSPGEWYEPRIPAPIRYPVSLRATRLAITLEYYTCQTAVAVPGGASETRSTLFSRWSGIDAFPKE